MNIVRAKEQDVIGIMQLISECINSMEVKGIYQWNENYPDCGIIEEDIRKGYAYLIKGDNVCMAYFSINNEQPIEYNEIKWTNKRKNVLVVHRLAVNPQYQGRGVASKMMHYIEEYALHNKYSSIRLDVYSCNKIAQKLYSNYDYRQLGEVFFPNRSLPFYCMEKVLV